MELQLQSQLWLRKYQSRLNLGRLFQFGPKSRKKRRFTVLQLFILSLDIAYWGQNYDFNVKKLIKASGFISVLHTYKDTHCFAQFHRETFGFSTHFKLLQSESLMVPFKIYFWIQQALSKLYFCLKESNSQRYVDKSFQNSFIVVIN